MARQERPRVVRSSQSGGAGRSMVLTMAQPLLQRRRASSSYALNDRYSRIIVTGAALFRACASPEGAAALLRLDCGRGGEEPADILCGAPPPSRARRAPRGTG